MNPTDPFPDRARLELGMSEKMIGEAPVSTLRRASGRMVFT